MAKEKQTERVASPIFPFAEYVRIAAHGKRVPGASNQSHENDDDWAGCSFNDAVRLATYGWPEGVKGVQAALSAIGSVDTLPAWELDVAGVFPCIPAYLSGSPVAMYAPVETDGAPRRIALCVTMSASYTVEAQARFRFAAALSQVASDLTAAGIDVAVYSFEVSTDRDDKRHCIGVAVREFGEPFDLTRVAFSGHPAFHRRLRFALCENTERHLEIGRNGYGCPQSVTVKDARACGVDLPDECIRCLPQIRDNRTSTEEYIEQFRKIIGEALAA
jgi:hypothetical protein